jgi:hypothetical protein
MNLLAIILLVLSSGLLMIAYYFADKWQFRVNQEQKEYDYKYDLISCHIESMPVTPENYDAIYRMLTCLGKLPYKNKEKTEVLTNRFWIRFQSERLARLGEDEFSPYETFRKY